MVTVEIDADRWVTEDRVRKIGDSGGEVDRWVTLDGEAAK